MSPLIAQGLCEAAWEFKFMMMVGIVDRTVVICMHIHGSLQRVTPRAAGPAKNKRKKSTKTEVVRVR